MKTKIIITLLILGLVHQIHAQIPLEGKVIDAITKESIPYVNIGIIELSTGTVSTLEGIYALNAKSENDIVIFSAIGYENIEMRAETLASTKTVELKSKDYSFETIEIIATEFEEKEVLLGVKNKKRGHSIGFGSAQLGTEIGAAIKVKKPTFVKSANFTLNHAKGDSLLFRVNIYELHEDEIGENILAENILIREKQRTGTITVDLSMYNIVLESDVLLTLEWLRNFDQIGNKEITFDTKKSKNRKGVYTRYSSNGEFNKLPYKKGLKPCFYFIGKQSK